MKRKVISYTGGEFRSPVTVEFVSYTDDGAGGQVTTWTPGGTVWCDIIDAGGDEPYSDTSDGRKRTVEKAVFSTWYRSDLLDAAAFRLNWAGRLWNVTNVDDVQYRAKFIEMTATAGVEN
jgi:SPP1 family predicted phage head-tail adaptor